MRNVKIPQQLIIPVKITCQVEQVKRHEVRRLVFLLEDELYHMQTGKFVAGVNRKYDLSW